MKYKIEFRQLWRLTNIYRWHMCSKTREQTVAEHCANVQFICLELMKGMNLPEYYQMKVLYTALMHDIDEVLLGDSTPMMKVHTDYQPPDIIHDWPQLQVWKNLVSLADKIEAFKFLREYGTGEYAVDVLSEVLEEVKTNLERVANDLNADRAKTLRQNVADIMNNPRDIVI